jgi:hypothetical protein
MLEWEDQLPMPTTPPSPTTPRSNPQTPNKRAASTMEHESSPAQKRANTSAATPSPQRAAASQARLAAMLRAQEEANATASPSTSAVHNNASSSRPPAISQTSQSSPLLPSWGPTQTSASASFQPVTPPPTTEQAERHHWPLQTSLSMRAPAAESEHLSRTSEHSNSPRNGMQNNTILGASVVRDGEHCCSEPKSE